MSNRMDWMLFTWDLYRCCKIRIRSHLSIRPCITVVGCVKCFADNFSKKFKFNLWRLCNSNFLCFERDYRPTDRQVSLWCQPSHLTLMDNSYGLPKNQITHAHSFGLQHWLCFVLPTTTLLNAVANIYVTKNRQAKPFRENPSRSLYLTLSLPIAGVSLHRSCLLHDLLTYFYWCMGKRYHYIMKWSCAFCFFVRRIFASQNSYVRITSKCPAKCSLAERTSISIFSHFQYGIFQMALFTSINCEIDKNLLVKIIGIHCKLLQTRPPMDISHYLLHCPAVFCPKEFTSFSVF